MGIFKDIMTDLMDYEDEVVNLTGMTPEELPEHYDTQEITTLWRIIRKMEAMGL